MHEGSFDTLGVGVTCRARIEMGEMGVGVTPRAMKLTKSHHERAGAEG